MTTATHSSAAAIAANIGDAWARHLVATARPGSGSPHPYVYASSYRTCLRRMVYEMTVPGVLPPWPAEVLAKFRRGDDRERDLLTDLTRVGRDSDPPFAVVGQQERFTLKDHKGRIAIAGKVDARLEVGGARAPVEVKSWSPMMVDRLETFEDLFDNPWTRSGGYQLLSYLYGAGEPFGFLLLDRSGIPRLMPVELDAHLDRVEDFLTRAEQAIDHVEAGTLPDYLDDDPAECRRCAWYGHTCNPPIDGGPGARLFTDPELEAQLARREELKPAADEYAGIDRDVKARLRGVEDGIAGKFHIVGRWQKLSRVDVASLPAPLKKQYTTTDPHGRFMLDITRIG